MRHYAICVKQTGRKERGWLAWNWSDLDKPKITWKETLWYDRKSDGLTCASGSTTHSLVEVRGKIKVIRALAKRKAKGKFRVEIWLLDYHGNPCEKVPLKPEKQKRRSNRIIFNLENRKNHWYDKIASGEKTVEYRRICDHWMRRLCEKLPNANGHKIRRFDIAEFRLGYKKQGAIVRKITNIDIGPCPYPGWNGEYFRIHFENGENK